MKKEEEKQSEIYAKVVELLKGVKMKETGDTESFLFLSTVGGKVSASISGTDAALINVLLDISDRNENVKYVIIQAANMIAKQELPEMLTDILDKLTNSAAKKDTCNCAACQLRRSLQKMGTKPGNIVN